MDIPKLDYHLNVSKRELVASTFFIKVEPIKKNILGKIIAVFYVL